MVLPYNLIDFKTPPRCIEERENQHTITVGTYIVRDEPTWYYRLNGNWDREKGRNFIIDQGYIEKNKETERYIAFTAKTFIPFPHFRLPRNWLWKTITFPRSKWCFINVPRNACSCLLTTAAKEADLSVVKEEYKESEIAWSESSLTALVVRENEVPSGEYKLAFVYSDPFLRWCNSCNFFEGIASTCIGDFYTPRKKREKLDKMYDFLAKCKLEGRYGVKNTEEHLRSQLFLVGQCPREPDLVIPIHLLSTFLRSELGIEPVRANVEAHWWFNPEKDVPGDIKEKVRNLYNEDYDLPTLFSDSFYYPKNYPING